MIRSIISDLIPYQMAPRSVRLLLRRRPLPLPVYRWTFGCAEFHRDSGFLFGVTVNRGYPLSAWLTAVTVIRVRTETDIACNHQLRKVLSKKSDRLEDRATLVICVGSRGILCEDESEYPPRATK